MIQCWASLSNSLRARGPKSSCQVHSKTSWTSRRKGSYILQRRHAHRIQTGENPYVKEATAKQQSRKRKADNCAKEGAERRLAFQREKSVYPMQSRGRKLPSDWMTGIASQCKPETDIEMANIILVNNLEVCDTWLPSVSKVMANSDCFTRP